MAISPEVKPRVSVTTDYDATPMRSTAAETRRAQMESNTGNSIGYALAVLALLVAAYFLYAYYGQTVSVPAVTTETTTPVAPPVVPPADPVVPAPSVTTPLEPATPPATTTPVVPANPPASTTTP